MADKPQPQPRPQPKSKDPSDIEDLKKLLDALKTAFGDEFSLYLPTLLPLLWSGDLEIAKIDEIKRQLSTAEGRAALEQRAFDVEEARYKESVIYRNAKDARDAAQTTFKNSLDKQRFDWEKQDSAMKARIDTRQFEIVQALERGKLEEARAARADMKAIEQQRLAQAERGQKLQFLGSVASDATMLANYMASPGGRQLVTDAGLGDLIGAATPSSVSALFPGGRIGAQAAQPESTDEARVQSIIASLATSPEAQPGVEAAVRSQVRQPATGQQLGVPGQYKRPSLQDFSGLGQQGQRDLFTELALMGRSPGSVQKELSEPTLGAPRRQPRGR